MIAIGAQAFSPVLGQVGEDVVGKYAHRLITSASIEDNVLHIAFDDGSKIQVRDIADYCCENRYMTTDDDVSSLVGHRLLDILEKAGSTEGVEYEYEHETVFVEVQTSGGFITLVNHNEHNGYYGGFNLTITEVKP